MATFAARRLGDIVDNLAGVLAIELLASAQAIEFHRPKQTSEKLENIVSQLRRLVPSYEKDRYFAPDIEQARQLILTTDFNHEVLELLPSYD